MGSQNRSRSPDRKATSGNGFVLPFSAPGGERETSQDHCACDSSSTPVRITPVGVETDEHKEGAKGRHDKDEGIARKVRETEESGQHVEGLLQENPSEWANTEVRRRWPGRLSLCLFISLTCR